MNAIWIVLLFPIALAVLWSEQLVALWVERRWLRRRDDEPAKRKSPPRSG